MLLAATCALTLLTTATVADAYPSHYRGYYAGGFRMGGVRFAPAGPSFAYRPPAFYGGYGYRPAFRGYYGGYGGGYGYGGYPIAVPAYVDSWGGVRPVPYANGMWPYYNPYVGPYGGSTPNIPAIINQFLFMFGRY